MLLFIDSVDETDDDESRLLRKLFKNYDPEVRPVLKISDAVTVRIGISLFQLIQVVSVTLVGVRQTLQGRRLGSE